MLRLLTCLSTFLVAGGAGRAVERAATFLQGAAAGRASANDGDNIPDTCTCDCCLSQRWDGAGSGGVKGGMKCSPRAGAPGLEGGAAGTGDGGCGNECAAPSGLALAYGARTAAVDYVRFCATGCHTVGTELNVLCAAGAPPAPPPQPRRVVALPASAVSISAAADAAMDADERALSDAGQPPAEESIGLAKGDMIAAMVQAKAAGEAAMIAKESYEEVMASPRMSAVEAGKATMAEIKREAGEQAKEAMLIRIKYEEDAKAAAQKAAQAAAKPYRAAMMRDFVISADWALRSRQYATAAAQRKAMAVKDAQTAKKYRALSEWDLARNYIVQAHQAMDNAKDFAASSQAAIAQANAVQKETKWYLWAEQAAAANMLAKSMPPDVPPPGMPPLPGL